MKETVDGASVLRIVNKVRPEVVPQVLFVNKELSTDLDSIEFYDAHIREIGRGVVQAELLLSQAEANAQDSNNLLAEEIVNTLEEVDIDINHRPRRQELFARFLRQPDFLDDWITEAERLIPLRVMRQTVILHHEATRRAAAQWGAALDLKEACYPKHRTQRLLGRIEEARDTILMKPNGATSGLGIASTGVNFVTTANWAAWKARRADLSGEMNKISYLPAHIKVATFSRTVRWGFKAASSGTLE